MKKVELSSVVEALIESEYRPLPSEMKQKAKFWAKSSSDALALSDVVETRANAERLVQGRLTNWDAPGFQTWFFNKDEFRQDVAYSAMLALNALNEVLMNTDPKAQGARVQAIKVAMDLAGKVPQKQTNIQVNNHGSQIGQMDRAQLEAYIAKSMGQLPPATVITLDNEEEV